MKRVIAFILFCGLMLTVGCFPKADYNYAHLMSSAAALKGPPYKRNDVVKIFNLEKVESRMSGGSLRSGNLKYEEEWKCPGDYIICGSCSKLYGENKIDGSLIDEELRFKKINYFYRVWIINKSRKVVFDTNSDR